MVFNLICQHCGQAFQRGKEQQYCSPSCRNKARTIHLSKPCAYCGKTMQKYIKEQIKAFQRRKYCSLDCRANAQRGPKVPPNTTCQYCGKAFKGVPVLLAKGFDKYCSRECAAKGKTIYPKRANCRNCGVEFEYYSSSSGRYCSQVCYHQSYQATWHEKRCENCGIQFKVRESELRKSPRRFCSADCFVTAYVGEKTFLWRGGKSFEPYPIGFNRALKRAIRQRDNHICQSCNKTTEENGRALAVHHIDYNKSNLAPTNLIALCESCHSKTNTRRDYWPVVMRDILRGRGIL